MAKIDDVNQKLDYLEATKQQIKNAIETMGQDISDTDAFRNYVDKILDITTGIDTSAGTMVANDLRAGKIGYSKGVEITGTAEFPQEIYDNSSNHIGYQYNNMNWYNYNKAKLNTKPENVLLNTKFLGEDGIETGTMPNNGELNIEPEDRNITIPAGYTSGGTVSKMDITKSSDYDTCLDLSLEILGI